MDNKANTAAQDRNQISVLEETLRKRIRHRQHISRDTVKDYENQFTAGQKLADQVDSFGGSWPFVILFGTFLIAWIVLNSFLLLRVGQPFDPYPYIQLNLILSTLAAIQAPIILMSQNRQSDIDRLQASHDNEVNLKSELEIMQLTRLIEEMRTEHKVQSDEMLKIQRELLSILRNQD